MPSEENLRKHQAQSKEMLLVGRQIHENSLINMRATTDLQNVTNHTNRFLQKRFRNSAIKKNFFF